MESAELQADLPLVEMTLRGRLKTEDVETIFDKFEEAVESGQHYVIIVDVLSLSGTPSAPQIQVMAKRMKRLNDTGRKELGAIVIMDSPVVKKALSALSWLTRRKIYAAKTRAEAHREATEIFKAKGVALPQSLTVTPTQTGA